MILCSGINEKLVNKQLIKLLHVYTLIFLSELQLQPNIVRNASGSKDGDLLASKLLISHMQEMIYTVESIRLMSQWGTVENTIETHLIIFWFFL